MSTFVTSKFLKTLSELSKICRESNTCKLFSTDQLESDFANVDVPF